MLNFANLVKRKLREDSFRKAKLQQSELQLREKEKSVDLILPGNESISSNLK